MKQLLSSSRVKNGTRRPRLSVSGLEEFATILSRGLVQDGVGLAVALLQVEAVAVGDRIIDREHVERLAGAVDPADFAGLAVVARSSV